MRYEITLADVCQPGDERGPEGQPQHVQIVPAASIYEAVLIGRAVAVEVSRLMPHRPVQFVRAYGIEG